MYIVHSRSITHLELDEESLELVRDAFCSIISIARGELPGVEGISELGRHVEGLQEAVEVAGHGLVHQSHKPWM